MFSKTHQQVTTSSVPKKTYGNAAETSIIVSFREEQGRVMHAAFYDHYLIRRITQRSTLHAIAPANDGKLMAERTKNFENYLSDPNTIHCLDDKKTEKNIPAIAIDVAAEGGLLFIPGQRKFPKPGEYYEERKAYEAQLIKAAQMRGQPILAICGGSWKLWESFGGTLAPVKGHTSPTMPSLMPDGSVGNNPAVHAIELMDNTILKGCMSLDSKLNEFPIVNSVHWAAPSPTKEILKMVQVSAVAKALSAVAIDSKAELPDINTIEAFENRFGAPFVGIQWHPEAYYKVSYANESEKLEYQRHLNIIRYMAKSGDAYQAKRKMLVELKSANNKLRIFTPQSVAKSKTTEAVTFELPSQFPSI